MKRQTKDFSQSPPPIIQILIFQFNTQAAKQRILIISSIINAWWQTATPINCKTSFYTTRNFPYKLQKVLANRFVRQQERGISITTQIIISKEKRIEIASDFLPNTY